MVSIRPLPSSDLGEAVLPQSPSKPIYPYVVFIDEGHGGIDPLTGKYTTAPSKMWKHKEGVFHNGTEFYEGVSNRIIGSKLIKLLEAEGIKYVRLAHEYKDTSRPSRYENANYYHKTVQKGFGISIHSNASQTHDARGWCVFTSMGETDSDKLAAVLYDRVEFLLKDYGIRMRTPGTVDKNGIKHKDYDSKLDMVHLTKMPFILPENLFFDQIDDARLLMDEKVQDLLAQAHFEMILWGMANLKL